MAGPKPSINNLFSITVCVYYPGWLFQIMSHKWVTIIVRHVAYPSDRVLQTARKPNNG